MPPQNTSKVPVGAILGEKFKITREIGRGGMAAVYEAENVVIGKRVAVKVLAAELLTSRVVRERFLREARAAAAIRSQYICDVYDSGTYEERPFLVMELLEGESLYEMMTRIRRLEIKDTVTIIGQTCKGLQKAHDINVIHRDLKPENLFITRTPDGEILTKIVDFGLAKFYEPTGGDAAQARLTREGALFGTPAYMSPEQAKGQGEVDKRADLWALGCIAFECLTGTTVWNVDQGVAMILAQIAGAPIPRPSRLRPDLPQSFDTWFLKALDRDAEKRFQTATEFAESLEKALNPRMPSRAFMPSPSSQSELRSVDDLLETDPDAATQPAPSVAPVPRSSAAGSFGPPSAPLPDASIAAAPAATRSSTSAKIAGAVAVLSVLGVGGYAASLFLIPQKISVPTYVSASTGSPSASASVAPPSGSALVPQETVGFAKHIGEGQAALLQGDREKAATAFRDAFSDGQTGVARGLLGQLGAAVLENGDAKCKTIAIGRPRPFDALTPISRPAYAALPQGGLAAWVDVGPDQRKRQAFAVLVDGALRRLTAPRSLTPEASNVRHVQLQPAGGRLAMLYWDEASSDPGVFVRFVGQDARIAGPARRLSSARSHEFSPSMARAGDGGFWAVWTEPTEGDMVDLFARKLSAELEPTGAAVRLTAHELVRGLKIGVELPRVATAGGRLLVAYGLRRGPNESRVELLDVAENDPALAKGVAPGDKPGKAEKGDRFVGTRRTLSKDRGRATQPRIACTDAACWVAWDDERAGAFVAYVDPKKGDKLWHQEFARKGKRPEVTVNAGRGFVAWVDPSRVRIAELTTDEVKPGSIVGKIGGFQPYPELVPEAKPGAFTVAWRDYESGHLEGYAARVECP